VNASIGYLDLDDVIELARVLLGDPPRSAMSACSVRPSHVTDVAARRGCVPRPDDEAVTAALLQSVVDHHALVDGNKRLGWFATAVFLEINGTKAQFDADGASASDSGSDAIGVG
jgi:death-on-curing protein